MNTVDFFLSLLIIFGLLLLTIVYNTVHEVKKRWVKNLRTYFAFYYVPVQINYFMQFLKVRLKWYFYSVWLLLTMYKLTVLNTDVRKQYIGIIAVCIWQKPNDGIREAVLPV